MQLTPHRRAVAALLTGLVVLGAAYQSRAGVEPGKSKPSVTMKATPVMGFSPVRVVVSAELRGGDDSRELYCGTEEWDWGDDTRSKNEADCDPYEEGKSAIKRRFSLDHVFQSAGDYRIEFSLKQKNKVIARGATEVKVRPGIRDNTDMR